MDKIKLERSRIRRQQTSLVIPLVGQLLDRWDELPNDVKFDEELCKVARIITKIDNIME